MKTHGLKGELNASLDVDDDFLSEDYPLIVELDGAFVPFYPESYRPKGHDKVLIKLEDVDFEEAANFVNKDIFARKKDLAEFYELNEDDLLYEDDVIGFSVVDADNNEILGTVSEIDTNTINTLLIVKRLTTDETFFIPFVDDFVQDIDSKCKVIMVNLPDGLIDLNENK